jgi:hypothetical protein
MRNGIKDTQCTMKDTGNEFRMVLRSERFQSMKGLDYGKLHALTHIARDIEVAKHLNRPRISELASNLGENRHLIHATFHFSTFKQESIHSKLL